MTSSNLISYSETLYEIASYVTEILCKLDYVQLYPGLSHGLETQGSSWLRSKCIDFAEQFEELYADELWIDKDWLDTVCDFTMNKLKQL